MKMKELFLMCVALITSPTLGILELKKKKKEWEIELRKSAQAMK